jgi:Reverse transcriptase-like
LLVANQINGVYEAKEVHIQKYLAEAQKRVSWFDKFTIKQVPRAQNKEADALSKLASMLFKHLTKKVLVEVLDRRSIEGVPEEMLEVAGEPIGWITPIKAYLE